MKKLLLSLATVLLLASCGGGSELSKQLAEKEKEVNTAIEQHEKALKNVEDAIAKCESDPKDKKNVENYVKATAELEKADKALRKASDKMQDVIDEYVDAQREKADELELPESIEDILDNALDAAEEIMDAAAETAEEMSELAEPVEL